MAQEMTLQEALQWILQARRDAWEFYQLAAQKTRHKEGSRCLQELADEQFSFARETFDLLHREDALEFERWFSELPPGESAQLHQMKEMLDEWVDDRKAMEMALAECQGLAKVIEYTSAHIIDPAVRAHLSRALENTQKLYQRIESDYAHQMGMVNESEMDTYVRE